MHVASRKMIQDFCKLHPEAQESMDRWYHLVKSTKIQSLNEIKQLFPSADQVQNFVVFNIGGNKYRIIGYLKYSMKRLYIRYVLTHKEYDKEKWKEDSWYKNTKN